MYEMNIWIHENMNSHKKNSYATVLILNLYKKNCSSHTVKVSTALGERHYYYYLCKTSELNKSCNH